MKACIILGTLLILAAGLGGCVTEEVPGAERPPRLFEPMGTYLAGAYHGVNLFFEVDPDDIPEASEWMRREGERQLPPIIPEIARGGREIYRVRDIHRVEYVNSMFHVGEHRYVPMPQARLYVFKERKGNLSFTFRGQGIVVPSSTTWIPSIFYYAVEEPTPSGGILQKEVVQVGFATIESLIREGKWLVNGKTFYPDPKTPLELQGAGSSTGARGGS